MFIADLTPNCYFAVGPSLRSVGWLDEGHPFSRGVVATSFLRTLTTHLDDPFGVIDFCGPHRCTLCPGESGPLGKGELIIPGHHVCYVAPVLIRHYVEANGYCPPMEFVSALELCPPQHSSEYMALVEPFLPELAPSGRAS